MLACASMATRRQQQLALVLSLQAQVCSAGRDEIGIWQCLLWCCELQNVQRLVREQHFLECNAQLLNSAEAHDPNLAEH